MKLSKNEIASIERWQAERLAIVQAEESQVREGLVAGRWEASDDEAADIVRALAHRLRSNPLGLPGSGR